MPHAHGRDRVEPLDGGRFRIVSPTPKGWRPGRPATKTRAEFPGTAVAWDEALWEVVSSEERIDANSRYVLAPWSGHHAIRLTVDYSEESEKALAAEHRKNAARNRMSGGLLAMGLFTGHLPAHVQKQIESEYGILATRMTLLSLIPDLAVVAVATAGLPIEELPGPKWPAWVLVVGFLALVDILVRSQYCLQRSQPIGSVFGLFFWAVGAALVPRARRFDREASRKAESKLSASSVRAPTDFDREHDLYAVREPFLALLPAEDQMRLATTFGFDPIVWGRRSALTIGILAGAGAVSNAWKIVDGIGTGGTWLSLAIASLFVAEQVKRAREMAQGNPAGSVLGAIVRPWCTILLTMKPIALEKGSTRAAATALPEVWEGEEPEGPDSENQTGR